MSGFVFLRCKNLCVRTRSPIIPQYPHVIWKLWFSFMCLHYCVLVERKQDHQQLHNLQKWLVNFSVGECWSVQVLCERGGTPTNPQSPQAGTGWALCWFLVLNCGQDHQQLHNLHMLGLLVSCVGLWIIQMCKISGLRGRPPTTPQSPSVAIASVHVCV